MKARTVILVGILLSICLIALRTIPGTAAPAPDADRQPRKTLETLKKKLPQVVTGVVKSDAWFLGSNECKVKLVRRIAADEAKIILVLEGNDGDGKHLVRDDDYLVIHLRYFDGAWTTIRFEGSFHPDHVYIKRAAHALMLAIDQLGEK